MTPAKPHEGTVGAGAMGRLGAVALLLGALLLLIGGAAAARWAGTEHVLATFTTDLASRSDAQRTNIAAAAARIDGRVVAAGATFSFNDTVGRRGVESGYERAPGFSQGGVADTTGGGICQLSSSVYNVALLSGMRIDERAPHARLVRSVSMGRDATVVHGHVDLRFTNPWPFPVRLRAHVTGARLVVEAVASQPLPAPVTLRVEQAAAPSGVEARVWRRTGSREEQVSVDVYPR